MKGKRDHKRQLDALAAAICGRKDVVKLAGEMGIDPVSIYGLANSAIKRLTTASVAAV